MTHELHRFSRNHTGWFICALEQLPAFLLAGVRIGPSKGKYPPSSALIADYSVDVLEIVTLAINIRLEQEKRNRTVDLVEGDLVAIQNNLRTSVGTVTAGQTGTVLHFTSNRDACQLVAVQFGKAAFYVEPRNLTLVKRGPW